MQPPVPFLFWLLCRWLRIYLSSPEAIWGPRWSYYCFQCPYRSWYVCFCRRTWVLVGRRARTSGWSLALLLCPPRRTPRNCWVCMPPSWWSSPSACSWGSNRARTLWQLIFRPLLRWPDQLTIRCLGAAADMTYIRVYIIKRRRPWCSLIASKFKKCITIAERAKGLHIGNYSSLFFDDLKLKHTSLNHFCGSFLLSHVWSASINIRIKDINEWS